MITFYKADETDFDNNGLGVLDHDIQNPDIEEKLNDIFTFSFNYPIFGVNGSRLAARMIVKADDPENEGQLFRIMKLSKSNGMLTAFCYHIFYDLNGNEIPDTNIVGQNGQTAITQMLSKTAVAHKFQGYSDIAETANIRVVRMSPVKFLIDPQTDNNFINRLGGEIRRVNYRIWMNKVRGSDNGATIRWKKSLDSYNATWDYTTIATRIRPVGYNGIMLPESYVDSPLINKYETIVIKEIQYSDIKAIDPNATSNDETAVPLEEAYELLRQAAAKEFSENNLDKPTVTLSVNMVALRNMDEYKDVKSLETIYPWDTVTVINERDGLSVKVRLNHYHWNPVTHKFISMELGNAKSTFTDIGSKVDHATNIANQANDTANTAAESANGKNSNYYGPSEPSRPVDGDLWYKKNGDKTELWQYDGKSVPPGWKLVVDDATGEEVRQNVDAAQKEAEEAKKTANESVAAANDAVAKAGFANNTADQAKSDAAAAGQQAKDALTSAGTAITDAQNALTNSSSAMADSAQARKDSANAIKDAADSLTSAKDAISKVGTLTTSVTSQFTTVNNELKSKVNQTDYDKLKGTVTSQQTEINQNASGIKLKADKSYVDTINNSVVKNTSSVGLLNDQIALTVSKAELNNTLSSYATQTWTQSQIKSTADQINLSVETVKKTVNNMAIGGRNYFSVSGFIANKYTNDGKIDFYDLKLLPNTKYIVSTNKTVNNLGYADIFAGRKGLVPITPSNGVMAGQSQIILTDTTGVLTIAARNYSIADGQDKIQVELGTVATTWQPAPEDLATEVQFSQLQLTVNGIQGTVQNKADQSQVTQLANQISLKADTTALNELKGAVDKQGSEITLNTNSIKLKADQSSVNTLEGTVDKQGSAIDVNTKAIALKASQSTVDTLSGRVSTAEGKITVQADQISQTVSKTELTTKLNGYATQTWAQGKLDLTANGLTSQISSVQTNLDNMQVGGRNLVLNSDFENATTNVNNINSGRRSVSTDYSYQGDQSVKVSIDSGIIEPDSGVIIRPKNAQPNETYTATGWLYSDVSRMLNIGGLSANWAFISRLPVDLAAKTWTKFKYHFTTEASVANVGVAILVNGTTSIDTQPFYIDLVKIEQGNKATDWSPAPEDMATAVQFTSLEQTLNGFQTTVANKADQSQVTQLANQITSVVGDVSANSSQITQMKADINLRVKAGDVVNQINISPESILIAGQKVHITGQTSIDNAVIKDAMIANVKADKITAGTLNAANVNVINLNANNITTGTIKGANLSMNLNTGEVLFQKGAIRSTNGNLNIDIASGKMAVMDKNGDGFFFEDGMLLLSNSWDTGNAIKYGSITYGAAWGGGRGIIIQGVSGATLETAGHSDSGEVLTESGINVYRDQIRMTSVGPVNIVGGSEYSVGYVKDRARIDIGSSVSDALGNRIIMNASYIHLLATYRQTASGSANVIVTSDGALVRSTSASKYKTDIIRTNATDYGDKLLNMPTATWTDIAETKRYRDDPANQMKPTRNFGMIAEDLADAGLEMLVVRGTDGELEGINYDRIGSALIPVIAKLKNEVEILKQQLEAETA